MEATATVTATFTASPVVKPPDSPPPAPGCVVPGLKGLSLAKAKAALTKALCTVGKVTKPKAKKGKKLGALAVKTSKPGAGTILPAASKVDLKLGPKPKRKSKRGLERAAGGFFSF
jgi:beta-lactam-binding protein with PASTA domain